MLDRGVTMSVVKIVRYATTPEAADENARLVRDVYAELAQTRPGGLRYATFRLDDGVTFVHLAVLEAEENPLSSTAAFARFQADIGQRLVAGPDARDATVVGSYRFDDVTG
jgi:hypothetical protein